MYSPKIAEDLIPVLYRIARTEGIPMTRVVDQILRKALKDYDPTVAQDDASRCMSQTGHKDRSE